MATMAITTAQVMVDNYTKTRRDLIDETYGINDTKAIWFSIDQVNNFMASLTPDISGVRFYLGVYGPDDARYPNQTTIIAIGTKKDENGKDIDPLFTLGHGHWGGGDDPSPYNHGALCPPATSCG